MDLRSIICYCYPFILSFIVLIGHLESSWQCQSEDVTDNQREVYVFKHSCIVLRCRLPNQNEPVTISKAGTVFVQDLEKKRPVPRFHYNYKNNNTANQTVHEFKISNISTDDIGTWSFIYNGYIARSIKMNVFIRPSQEEPTCNTVNKFPVYITDDLLELNCSVHMSDPPVTLELDGLCNITDFSLEAITRSSQGGKQLGCRSRVTEMTNGSLFNCSFYQTYAPKSGLSPYSNLCQWGPIKIQKELTVSLNLLSPIIKGNPIGFECVSNVPDAIITWDLSFVDLKQSSSEPGRSSVNVTLPANYAHSTLNISCYAYYRQREVSANFVDEISTKKNPNVNASQRFVSCFYLLIAFPLLVQSL